MGSSALIFARHAKFGRGRVIARDGDIVTVLFETHGQRHPTHKPVGQRHPTHKPVRG
jgi:hypothetical protein